MLRPIPGDPWGIEQHHWNTGAKENQQLNPGGPSFLEVQDKCVNLSAVIQDFSPIVYNSDQMSFTAVPLSECMRVWMGGSRIL